MANNRYAKGGNETHCQLGEAPEGIGGQKANDRLIEPITNRIIPTNRERKPTLFRFTNLLARSQFISDAISNARSGRGGRTRVAAKR